LIVLQLFSDGERIVFRADETEGYIRVDGYRFSIDQDTEVIWENVPDANISDVDISDIHEGDHLVPDGETKVTWRSAGANNYAIGEKPLEWKPGPNTHLYGIEHYGDVSVGGHSASYGSSHEQVDNNIYIGEWAGANVDSIKTKR